MCLNFHLVVYIYLGVCGINNSFGSHVERDFSVSWVYVYPSNWLWRAMPDLFFSLVALWFWHHRVVYVWFFINRAGLWLTRHRLWNNPYLIEVEVNKSTDNIVSQSCLTTSSIEYGVINWSIMVRVFLHAGQQLNLVLILFW